MDRRGTGASPGISGVGSGGGVGGVGVAGGTGGGGLGPGSGSQHHRSRSATRTSTSNATRSYHSLDRDGHDREREFIPIRDSRDGSGRDGRDVRDVRDGRGGGGGGGDQMMMRDRSLERSNMDGGGGMGGGSRRDRSMDRNAMMDEEMLYGGGGGGGMMNNSGLAMPRSARQSPAVDMAMKAGGGGGGGGGLTTRESYLMEIQGQNSDLSRELNTLKRELEMTNQKLGSSMHSIKTFWSPELKKERALRKEESAKYSLINDQLKLLNAENQVSYFLFDITHFRFFRSFVRSLFPSLSRYFIDRTFLCHSFKIVQSIKFTLSRSKKKLDNYAIIIKFSG